MCKKLISFVLLSVCIGVAAQQELNNDAIVRLVKAGISEDLIVSTISAKPGAYDTSADGVAALKAAGASDRVIAAVMAKASSTLMGGDSNAGAAKSPKCYNLEYVHSDKKWWHGPGTATDRYDQISEEIRNALVEPFDKMGLRLETNSDPACLKFTVDLSNVKSRAVKTGTGLYRWSMAVDLSVNFRLEDGSGRPVYEKSFNGHGEEQTSPNTQIRDEAVLALAGAIANDEGLLKSLSEWIPAK
jgi:hypothetical protein